MSDYVTELIYQRYPTEIRRKFVLEAKIFLFPKRRIELRRNSSDQQALILIFKKLTL